MGRAAAVQPVFQAGNSRARSAASVDNSALACFQRRAGAQASDHLQVAVQAIGIGIVGARLCEQRHPQIGREGAAMSAGATPTIVYGSPSSMSMRPAIAGSCANWRFQRLSLRTVTRCWPGTSSWL
jgi:hypothetical protein